MAWAAAAIYLWRFAGRGWIPHDDGMLAQIAERILAGQVPHRDFDDPYTGGLGYLHAIAFLAFGVRLLSLRIALLLAAMAWIPAVFVVARRFVSPPGAAFVTAAAVAWTLPNYFAGMPSYYNMFFATWGTAALLRHLDTKSRIWLFIAGLCGGLSFLVKSSGLYFVGAAVVYLLYREQIQHRGTEPWSPAIFTGKAIFGLTFIAGLGALVIAHPGTTELFHFFVPGVVSIAVLMWSEWSEGRGPAGERIHGAAYLMLPFLSGVLLPVAVFMLPYILSGSVSAWYDGVFVAPRSRFQSAATPLPPAITMLAALPYALVLVAGATLAPAFNRRWSSVVLAAMTVIALVIVTGGVVDSIYRVVWYSARHLTIPVVLAGCLLLVRANARLSPSSRQELYLLVLLACVMPLIQIPFAAAIYFCYAAPFLLLAAVAVIRNSSTPYHPAHPVLLGGYLLFALLWTNTNYVWTLGTSRVPYHFVGAPNLPRAGITMTAVDRAEYSKVTWLIQQANGGKRYIYAGPDCPEVYFLSGTSNATRTMYEFLRPALSAGETLDVLDRQKIDVVVINRSPGFSSPLNPELVREFELRYPYSADAGRFQVRWRL